jgi:restriction system protein
MIASILSETIVKIYTYPIFGLIIVIFFAAFLMKFIEKVILPKKIKEKRRSKNVEYYKKYSELHNLKKMNHQDFEYFVADLFSNLGYKTKVVGGYGDGGIDIIAKKHGIDHYIQCKRYRKSIVGVSEVRDFFGAIISKRTEAKGFFVTTNVFSLEAEKFAEDKSIELIDGHKLVKFVEMGKGKKGKIENGIILS